MNLQPNPKLPADACLVNGPIEQDGRVVATLDDLVRPLAFDPQNGYLFQRLDNQETFYLKAEAVEEEHIVVSIQQRIFDIFDYVCFYKIDDSFSEQAMHLRELKTLTADERTLTESELVIEMLELYIERLRSGPSFSVEPWVANKYGSKTSSLYLLKDWRIRNASSE